jgi:nucleoside-diphosphate-sugar epimerase
MKYKKRIKNIQKRINNMRVIVTGGAGFVGTNLIKRLIAEGHTVTSVDNYSTGKRENEQSGCSYINCDMTAEEITVIIHKL